ncbi:hypothetical protein HMPREF9419_2332 [Prevotella nigrescens ATCC 33563]|nr:hypothetical protein HMPREF9419_2332 [Prevotella nigrescens ATCC 33563]
MDLSVQSKQKETFHNRRGYSKPNVQCQVRLTTATARECIPQGTGKEQKQT